MPQNSKVFVVDDDPALRDSLSMLLQASGYEATAFESAAAFLESDAPGAVGCLIVDVRMPGKNGLELQQELVGRASTIAVIVMTGHADIPIAVQAMKAGAVDFLEKPFEEATLLDSVSRAFQMLDTANRQTDAAREAKNRLQTLTEREHQVLDLIVAGKANKVVAYELSISPRTVEIHRSRVMEKMGARNLADLVRMALSVSQ